MDICSCGIAVQKQPRIDNDILLGIEKKNLKGALTKLSTSQRCNKQLHLDALDSLIATYEMQGRLDEALEFSLKMVNLSPREPKVGLHCSIKSYFIILTSGLVLSAFRKGS